MNNSVLITLISTTLIIAPNYSYDPINIPKVLVLTIMAFMLIGFLVPYGKILISRNFRVLFILSAVFVIQLILVVSFSGSYVTQQIFGTFGRNTGLITYLALISLLVSVALLVSSELDKKLVNGLLITGLANLVYGIIQFLGIDPIKWNNGYTPIITFLGNPNFASSFIAMSCISALVLVLGPKQSTYKRVSGVLFILAGLFLILKSQSIQGFIVFGIGALIFLYFYLTKQKQIKRNFQGLFFLVTTPLVALVSLGALKIGPLADYLYKVSVRQRGFYWHAAVKAMQDNPYFGVGLDSFGDNYYRYRSANAAFYSVNTQTNSAHNIFLDFGANGGFPLFIVYILLTLFAGWRAIKNLRRLEFFDPYFVTIFAVWVGFQAQSIISINQIGVAVWGWAFSGVLIGHSFIEEKFPDDTKKSSHKKSTKVPVSNWLGASVGLLLGVSLVFPKFQADHNYRVATGSGNLNLAIAVVQKYPKDLALSTKMADAISQSGFKPQAVEILRDVTASNPKYYPGWATLFSLVKPDSADSKLALLRMQELNPRVEIIKN
jgi:O-antigen ligase